MKVFIAALILATSPTVLHGVESAALWMIGAGVGWLAIRHLGNLPTSGRLGVCLVYFALITALCAPALAPFDPTEILEGQIEAPPSSTHWLGTDAVGRDVLSRVLHGGRVSLLVGLVAAGLSTAIGGIFGAVAGYRGGRIDRALGVAVDIAISLPGMVVLMAAIGIFRPPGDAGVLLMGGLLGMLMWANIAKMVRNEVASLRTREFVRAAWELGLSDSHIIRHHILPHVANLLVVYAAFATGSGMLTESSLGFLGIGVQIPDPTWGSMISDERDAFGSAPHRVLAPALLISLTVLGFQLLGDGVRARADARYATDLSRP